MYTLPPPLTDSVLSWSNQGRVEKGGGGAKPFLWGKEKNSGASPLLPHFLKSCVRLRRRMEYFFLLQLVKLFSEGLIDVL